MRSIVLILSFSAILQAVAFGQALESANLDAYLRAAVGAMTKTKQTYQENSFGEFRQAIAAEAEKRGDAKAAERIRSLVPGSSVPAGSFQLASKMFRKYVTVKYKDVIVRDLREIVGFRTHAEAGKTNWDLPEFERQRQWLRLRAKELGFEFTSYDGRVDEITFRNGDSVLAILTHGDVQPVEGQQWSSPPWDAAIVEERIIGRGTEDDKGPIIVALYVMKGLKDTGWRIPYSVKLLIANGEESDWSDIPYYQERAPLPSITLGIDASYPVTYAQKGFGLAVFRAERGAEDSTSGTWRLESLSGGTGPSIIPAQGEATLSVDGSPLDRLDELERKAARWTEDHPPASLAIQVDSFAVRVIAHGKGGHSSDPRNGHNALGDLAAFLSTLDLKMDAKGSLAKFLGAHVGTETTGKSLDIAASDGLLGELTHNLAVFADEGSGTVARSSVRIVQGFSDGEIGRRLQKKARDFNERHGTHVAVDFRQYTGPHVADRQLVSALLSVWKDVTGAEGRPLAIGGGTQARLFPNGVDFGPGFPNVTYRGHAPDEHLTVSELMSICELSAAAVWRLCGWADVPGKIEHE